MGLMSALSAATSGLRATQSGIDLVSQNIANSGTAGYTRRRLPLVESLVGDRGSGVRTGEIERVLDFMTQRQLRLETSGSSYTGYTANVLAQVDRLFGAPGAATSLDSTLNSFTQSLQALIGDPSSFSTRSTVLNTGAALASRLGEASQGIQALRTEAEGRIGAGVQRANALLTSIADVNAGIVSSGGGSAAQLDQRDRLVLELSQLVDVQTTTSNTGAITLTTTAGLTFFNGVTAARLSFDGRGTLGPNSVNTGNPATSGVGTITATMGGGSPLVVSGTMIRSGEIAAAMKLRDETLPQAQRQLDELAAGIARAFSDQPSRVTDANVAGFSGFNLDMSGLVNGDAAAFDFRFPTAAGPGTPQRVIVVPMNGATPVTTPPIENSDPNATVIQVDISGGLGPALTSLQGQLNAAFPGRFNTTIAGSSLQILGANGTTQMLGANITTASLASGQKELPFFVDGGRGNAPYLGGAIGDQLTGFSQRLIVNPALVADRSRLVVFSDGPPPTPQGDTTRAQHLLDSLTSRPIAFSSQSGLGSGFSGTVADFGRRVIETQGSQAASAAFMDEGQGIALANIEERFSSESGVRIDEEMAQLIQLQTAYGANARVMTAVKDMFDTLLRI